MSYIYNAQYVRELMNKRANSQTKPRIYSRPHMIIIYEGVSGSDHGWSGDLSARDRGCDYVCLASLCWSKELHCIQTRQMLRMDANNW
jgi:hypothetical protein